MSARVSCLRCALAGVALGAIGGAAWAQNGALPVSDLLIGDRIILKSKAVDFKGVLPEDMADQKTWEAPARTKLKVVNDTHIDGERTLTVTIADVPCVNEEVAMVTLVTEKLSSIRIDPRDCKSEALVREGHNYRISKRSLEDFGYRQMGFVYGGLLIPYKYFRHDKSLEPGTTIGPFLGYRLGQTGWGISIIGTLGLASIKLAQRDGDQIREQTVQGVSTAIGLMFDLQKSADPFRLGILWGRDRVGSNSAIAYPHEGKSWMAMQLGWEFGR